VQCIAIGIGTGTGWPTDDRIAWDRDGMGWDGIVRVWDACVVIGSLRVINERHTTVPSVI
jgi:hypothetical protein